MPLDPTKSAAAASKRAEHNEAVFDTPAVLTISAAHMGHDIYTAFLAPMLPLLIARLGMPMAAAGLLPSIFKAGSLLQPFTGALADRSDARYFLIATPAITALGMSLLGVAPSYFALVVLLALSGLSHAFFHPAAAATISRASGNAWGRGSAFYMTGGHLGFAIGPILIVSVVTWFGEERSYLAAIPGFIFSVLLYVALRGKERPRVTTKSMSGVWKLIKAQKRAILLLSGFVLFRSTASVSFNTFYPTHVTNEGASLLFAGFAMTVYQVAGAGGSLVGGILSDRLGSRATLVWSQLLAGPLLYLAVAWPESPAGLVGLAVGGAMIYGASPVQLTLFQQLLPEARSTAAGLFSLLNFEGSLATALVVGVVADSIGLGPALGFSVLFSMLSIPFVLAIKEPRSPGR